MLGLAVLAVLALVGWYLFRTGLAWRRNYLAAKASGIHFVLVPNFVFSLWVLLFEKQLLAVYHMLPKSWQKGHWTEVITPTHNWIHQRWLFDEFGTDTYLTVAPSGIMMWTSSADVISQITTRRNDFPKPTTMYGHVDIFGKNIVSSEGQVWRQHRKIAAPPFTEKNNHLVWAESIHQAQCMMKAWTGMDGNESRTIRSLAKDSMMLSLHIISCAGFGQKLLWPGVEDQDQEASTEKELNSGDKNMRPGHEMTYQNALHTFLKNLVLVILGGKILERLPWKHGNKAYKSFREWKKYMQDMMEDKKKQVQTGAETDGMDLLGAMIKSAAGEDGLSKPLLSDSEIMGNAFVFILAGHETTANTIHYSLIYLACNPEVQRRLQADIDSIFHGRKPEEWDYEEDLPRLFSGMVGATMNESLRLIPPVTEIPKYTHTPQPLNVDGKRCTVPANTLVSLSTAPAHRNPKYWPHGPPADSNNPIHPRSNLNNDLEEFKPERWLLTDEQKQTTQHNSTQPAATPGAADDEGEDASGGPTGDSLASLFKPPRGSYLPFSEGARSCLGKRFAQVEVLAVLAVVFNEWSVELALEDFVDGEQLDGLDGLRKKEVWDKAREKALFIFRERMESRITLQMRGDEHTPLRFMRRGKETM